MGNRIKELRKRYFISLQDLADKSNVPKATLHDIETGKHIANVYHAIRIARALFTTVEELFIEDEEENK